MNALMPPTAGEPLPFGRPIVYSDLKRFAAPGCRICHGQGFIDRVTSAAPRGSARNALCPCGSGLKGKRCACAKKTIVTPLRCGCTDGGMRASGALLVAHNGQVFLGFDPAAKLTPGPAIAPPRQADLEPTIPAQAIAETPGGLA